MSVPIHGSDFEEAKAIFRNDTNIGNVKKKWTNEFMKNFITGPQNY